MRARGAAMVLAPGLLAVATARCVLLTHSGEWITAPAPVDTRLCAMCADQPVVRSAPCPPPASDDAATADDRVWLYALRSLDFGSEVPADGGPYLAGLSLDCDPRTGGGPTLCSPAVASIGASWPALPGAVDNSFGNTVAVLAHDPTIRLDLQGEINRELDAGEWGLLLALDHWNGSADDDSVGVRLLFTKGVVTADGGSTPAWDGTDSWYVVAGGWDPAFSGHQVPDTTFKSSGYVAGGVLVWDGRGLVGAELRLRNGGGVPGSGVVGAYQVMNLDAPVLVGPITQQGVTGASFGGSWPGTSTNVNLAFLAGCDAALVSAIGTRYASGSDLVSTDLPAPGADAGQQCAAASVGLAMTFVRAASIAGPPVPFPPPSSPQCQAGGADGGP